MGDLQGGVVRLLDASIAPNTAAAYKTAINVFKQFLVNCNLPYALPIDTQHVLFFISYSFERGLSPNTINTYVAGINHFHKLHGYADLREVFIVKKMLEGCLRLKKTKDTRLPITIEILKDVCDILPAVCYNQFEANLFKAAFLLAFFGLFRVSEIVVPSSLLVNRTITREDISVDPDKKHIVITLKISKSNQSGPPTRIRLPCEKNIALCPVCAVREFINIRPICEGPFFCHANKNPVTRCQFSSVLAKCIKRVRPVCGHIRSHSFRIGRATQLSALGLSEDRIKTMGRWRSGAYKRYIRQ